jgi:TrmH family RNA methyltransferase
VGRANATFQHLEVLKRSRTHRRRYGEVLVEGVRPIQRLVAAGWPVHAVCSEDGRALSGWAESVIRASGAPLHHRLAPDLMARLSDREQVSELLVVAGTRARRLEELALPPDALLVLLDRPASPGNLGTVLRSADALGAHAVLVSGHAADPFDPQAVRASMGSVFTLPPVEVAGSAELERWLTGHPGTLVLGTDSAGEAALAQVDLRGPTMVVLGNEAAGASHGLRALCSRVARIPMVGSADSLNMAVAASIVLYEAARQRADNPIEMMEG